MQATGKRTYNLPASTIAAVRELAAVLEVPQDTVVVRAVREFTRLQRDLADSQRWRAVAADPEFQAEMSALATEFAEDDLGAWPT